MFRRRNALAAVAAAALLTLTACGSDDGDTAADGSEELTFLTPFSYILAYSDAMNASVAGHYGDEGLDVEFQAAQGSAQALTQLLAGQADVVRSDAIDVVNAVATNEAPLKVIGSITQQTPFYVISADDDPVETAADLEGKTIGIISVGGATDNLVKLMLANEGIDPTSVEVQAVGSGAGSWGLVQQGRIDAFVDTSSSKVALEQAGEAVSAWNIGDEVTLPSQVYVVTEPTLAEKPEALAAFLRATRTSMEEILASDDLASVIEGMSGEFEIGDASDPEAGAASLEADSSLWAAAGEENLLTNQAEQWDEGLALLEKAGLVSSAPEATDIYTDAVYDEAFGQ